MISVTCISQIKLECELHENKDSSCTSIYFAHCCISRTQVSLTLKKVFVESVKSAGAHLFSVLRAFYLFPSILSIWERHCAKACSIGSVLAQSPLQLVHCIMKIQCLIANSSRKGLLEAETLEEITSNNV